MDINNYLKRFSELSTIDFSDDLHKHLYDLHHFHSNSCSKYEKLTKNLFESGMNLDSEECLNSLPFIPVNAFKTHKLISCPDSEIFKILHSSGTSSQTPSSIYLTRDNARHQSIALSKIFSLFTNLNRPNIIIVDSPNLISNRTSFNARIAGIIGFRGLCRKAVYALDNEYKLDLKSIHNFLESIGDQDILIFGFTWILFKYLLGNKIPDLIKDRLSKATILHGGGWKKLVEISVSREVFNSMVFDCLGSNKVISYYGMIEQTGSIFMECENGFLHTNPLATLISRSQEDLQPLTIRQKGLGQVFSAIPSSYPGHSLLTDDIVEIIHQKNCSCGRPGKSFLVHGRIKSSEVRGCSDTFNR